MDINEVRKELGSKLKEIRKIKGFTQEVLAEKANLNYKYLGELERGKVNVSLDSLLRISQALEINMGDLFRRKEETILQIIFSKMSSQDFELLKKSSELLNIIFSKI